MEQSAGTQHGILCLSSHTHPLINYLVLQGIFFLSHGFSYTSSYEEILGSFQKISSQKALLNVLELTGSTSEAQTKQSFAAPQHFSTDTSKVTPAQIPEEPQKAMI